MPDGRPMIQAEGLQKRYGATVALAGVDLDVPPGRHPRACSGRTAPARRPPSASSRPSPSPTAGHARVAGYDVVTEAAQVRRNIGVTAQDATLDEMLTGRQNLVMIGRLSGLHRAEARARAADLLDQFDLADAADRVLKGYSGGMRRRLDLAAGLVTRPPVLFLDEPTTGLDPTSRVRMWGIIRALVADGVTLAPHHPVPRRGRRARRPDRRRRPRPGHRRGHRAGAQDEDRRGPPRGDPARARHRPRREPLGPFVAGAIQVSHDGRRLRAPVRSGDGLATTIVRALDEAGITVDDVALHQPSLDDVFFALTGHAAPSRPSEPDQQQPASTERSGSREGGRAQMTTVAVRLDPHRAPPALAPARAPGRATSPCSPGATSSTSPASRCSSRT